VGAVCVPETVPWKPKLVLPPVAIVPLYPAFTAVTWPPDWVSVAFQALPTRSPPAKAKVRRQAETGSPRLVILTSLVKPPSQ
jgi:hypothetical protein